MSDDTNGEPWCDSEGLHERLGINSRKCGVLTVAASAQRRGASKSNRTHAPGEQRQGIRGRERETTLHGSCPTNEQGERKWVAGAPEQAGFSPPKACFAADKKPAREKIHLQKLGNDICLVGVSTRSLLHPRLHAVDQAQRHLSSRHSFDPKPGFSVALPVADLGRYVS